MSPDLINGLFELAGAAFIWLSIRKVKRDRMVRGVSWLHVSFFAAWGFWNLFYYPSLGQWFSFAGGVALVGVNVYYVVLLLYYTIKEKQRDGRYRFQWLD